MMITCKYYLIAFENAERSRYKACDKEVFLNEVFFNVPIDVSNPVAAGSRWSDGPRRHVTALLVRPGPGVHFSVGNNNNTCLFRTTQSIKKK